MNVRVNNTKKMISTEKGSVLIIAQSSKDNRILLVKEPKDSKKPLPHYWKFPAGKVKIYLGEKHKEAAVREFKEETGLKIDIENLKMLGYKNTSGHILTIFGIYVPSFDEIAKKGITGEIPRSFELEEIYELKDFHPEHRRFFDFFRNGLLDLSFKWD